MATRNTPPVTPLEPWLWPLLPWQRVHIDYAERDGNNFLVLVDSHTKWLEVFQMPAATSQKTIDILRNLFVVWCENTGLCDAHSAASAVV